VDINKIKAKVKMDKGLQKWNYGAAALHLGAAIAASVLLKSKSKRIVQMTRQKFDANASTELSDSRVDIPVTLENDATVDLKSIVIAFFAITSVAHLLYATDFFGKGWYSSQIMGFGWNPFRWVEYSLSASLMIYLISAVSGTKDQVSAVSAALITPGLMINGFTVERALKQNALSSWTSKLVGIKPEIDADIVFSNILPGWALFGVHWYIILSNYTKLASEAKAANQDLDPSVTFMVFSQLIFFSLFGAIQSYQVYRWFTSRESRAEPSYIAYEKAYIVLSAVTKLLLAGTVAYSLRN
jgi:hypothetical protein